MRIRSDQEWFNELFRRQYPPLFYTALKLMGGDGVAEELVDEAFLILWSRREELREHPNPEGWLFLTLKNLISNETRRAKYLREIPLLFESGRHADAFEDALEMGRLADLLPDGLSGAEREILLLCIDEELSYEEVAERLGISVAACRTRLCRAKAHCKRLMEHQGTEA